MMHSAARPPKETYRMTDFTTDQAEREASGAHPYGRYLEEFEIGAVYKHWPAKTVTETEDHLFCLLTMNHHPLHVNDVYAAASQQGRNVVVGPMVYSLALGMSVSDISGKAIANLMTEELKHPAPVFHGDTLFCETEVLEKRESRTKLDRGTVRVHTRVLNQDGVLVAEFKRLVLVPRKDHGTPKAEGDRLDHETTWRDLTRCLGVEDSGQGLAKAESPAFGLGVGTQVNSAVEYLPAANVQDLATAFAAPKLTDCAKQAFSADVKRNAPEGATVGAVDVVPLEFAKLGQKASAFRATTKLDLGFPIDIYQDFVFVFKADSVSRVSFLNPGAPFQPELQRALVEAVVGRA